MEELFEDRPTKNSGSFSSEPKAKRKKLNVLPPNPDETEDAVVKRGRFPKWLHRRLPEGNNLWATQKILSLKSMPTVCVEAKCPNLLECWSKKTATFLAMGTHCTRSCGFCDINFSKNPQPLKSDEPKRLALAVAEMGLKHVVITMVARDDLEDGGALHLAKIIEEIRKTNPTASIEVLTSDFEGKIESLQTVSKAQPDIFNHNIETVRSLTPRVRHTASYDRTLFVLNFMKKQGHVVKSGFMVGLGEKEEEIRETIDDLHATGCSILTIGQYLQANSRKLRVKNFITPDQFENYSNYAKSIGFEHVYSGPFVRSSYNAAEVFENLSKKNINPY